MTRRIKSGTTTWLLSMSLLGLMLGSCDGPQAPKRKVGVAFLVHGGASGHSENGTFDSTLQIFSYDPNSFIYKNIIWNRDAWPQILRAGNAPKEMGKYSWEYRQIGGTDPAMELTRRQLAHMTSALNESADELNVEFVTDYVSWIGEIDHLAHPRAIYYPAVEGGDPVTYCGDPDNPWKECDPERYNADGTIDRMLAAGVEEIVVIDLTTSGVRFFKSNDVIRLSRKTIDEHNERNGTSVKLTWLNDPFELMRDSYPVDPEGWTNSLGDPARDPKIPLADRPNPVSSDPEFALLHAEGIEAQFNTEVTTNDTGVLLVNHATRSFNQLFDPKIDDTLILNANIREHLRQRNPGLKTENIVGAWMGVKEKNPHLKATPGNPGKLERTRRMRGENLGHAYLYETDEELPTGVWGYRYWDALAYLKDQGVQHIVVAFPQITVDSVLNMVELPNQIGKEIGYKTWLHIGEPDYETFPEAGHPFADYWGIWVETSCPAESGSNDMVDCCFEMSGCTDGRPYPPARLASLHRARNDLDPSLAYDVSEFGHLGYDASDGPPDREQPVQTQYRGTWATWNPPNADPRVGRFLARHVVDYLRNDAAK